MGRRKLKHLMEGEYRARGICSTGAEEAALLASQAGAADIALGGLGGSGGAEALLGGGFGAPAAFTLPFGLNPASVALQAGGGLLKVNAAQDAAARRQKLVDAMAAYQTGNAKKSMDVTGKFIEGDTPDARAAALNQAEADNKTGYDKTVGAVQAFEQPGGVSGNISPEYTKAQADSATAGAARTKMLVENLAKMRAPGVAGATEARRYGKAAGDVGALNSANANVGNAYHTDISNVQENPWASVGGDVLSGVGSGIALKDSLKKLRASAF